MERERDQASRLDRNQPRGAHAALRQHLLRRIQGISSRRWFRACVSHGSAYAAPAAKRPLAGAARARRSPSGRDGAYADQALPRCGAGSAGCALFAPHHIRHDREYRCGHDADHRGDAVSARQPGLGLFRRRREAAAHSGRRSEHALRAAHGHGENRRQLRRGAGAHHERAREASEPIRCCFVPMAKSRRPAPPTSC